LTSRTNNDATESRTKRLWPKLLVFVVVIAIWYVLLQVSPLDKWLLIFLARLENSGFWGPILFILLYIPACVLMFPDILPNAAAGAIWGIATGTAVVSIGRVLGSTATFLLARYFTRRWQERRMANDPKFAAVAKAVEREGFRFVLLLRLCPLFPVIMLNYGLGMTSIRLRSYMLGTLLGLMPRTMIVAYSGSGLRSVMDLASGQRLQASGNPMIYWGGLALSLIVFAILAHKARQLIQEATSATE
jgi:uncharacterized membrane protein YdjX (TVP38/TMEM64 family)